jgi:hypothetical protein
VDLSLLDYFQQIVVEEAVKKATEDFRRQNLEHARQFIARGIDMVHVSAVYKLTQEEVESLQEKAE